MLTYYKKYRVHKTIALLEILCQQINWPFRGTIKKK